MLCIKFLPIVCLLCLATSMFLNASSDCSRYSANEIAKCFVQHTEYMHKRFLFISYSVTVYHVADSLQSLSFLKISICKSIDEIGLFSSDRSPKNRLRTTYLRIAQIDRT